MLGVFLPLITTNCAVLGVALPNAASASIGCSSRSAFGAAAPAADFALTLLLFTALRERLECGDVPRHSAARPSRS